MSAKDAEPVIYVNPWTAADLRADAKRLGMRIPGLTDEDASIEDEVFKDELELEDEDVGGTDTDEGSLE